MNYQKLNDFTFNRNQEIVLYCPVCNCRNYRIITIDEQKINPLITCGGCDKQYYLNEYNRTNKQSKYK